MPRTQSKVNRAMSMAILVCVGLLLSSAARAQDKPDPAKPKATPAAIIAKAVAALNKEYASATKGTTDKPGGSLRTDSNYFTENADLAADLTPEAILAAIDKGAAGNPAQEAYTRWQLLSAVSGKFDEKLASRAAKAYQKAPMPMQRPGTTEAERKQMEAALRPQPAQNRQPGMAPVGGRPGAGGAGGAGMGGAVGGGPRQQIEQKMQMVDAANDLICKYRDALYRRTPGSPELFAAAAQDAIRRMQCGIDADEFLKFVVADMRTWTTTGSPKLADLRKVKECVQQMEKAGQMAPETVRSIGEGNVRAEKVRFEPEAGAFQALASELQMKIEAAGGPKERPQPTPGGRPGKGAMGGMGGGGMGGAGMGGGGMGGGGMGGVNR